MKIGLKADLYGVKIFGIGLFWLAVLGLIALSSPREREYTVKNIRRFYGKISGNLLPVHFPLFLQATVNIFRNQAQNGSKGHNCFCHTALQSYKGIFEYCRLT